MNGIFILFALFQKRKINIMFLTYAYKHKKKESLILDILMNEVLINKCNWRMTIIILKLWYILTFPGVLDVEARRRDVHSWLQHFLT